MNESQKEGTILPEAGVEAWIFNVTHLFTEKEICDGHNHKMDEDNYRENLIKKISRMLSAIR